MTVPVRPCADGRDGGDGRGHHAAARCPARSARGSDRRTRRRPGRGRRCRAAPRRRSSPRRATDPVRSSSHITPAATRSTHQVSAPRTDRCWVAWAAWVAGPAAVVAAASQEAVGGTPPDPPPAAPAAMPAPTGTSTSVAASPVCSTGYARPVGGAADCAGPAATVRRGLVAPRVPDQRDDRADHDERPQVGAAEPPAVPDRRAEAQRRHQDDQADDGDDDRADRRAVGAVPADEALDLRVLLALVRDQQPAGRVQQQPGAAEQRQHHDDDAQDQRVDAQVRRDAAARHRRPCGRCGCGPAAAGSRGWTGRTGG